MLVTLRDQRVKYFASSLSCFCESSVEFQTETCINFLQVFVLSD